MYPIVATASSVCSIQMGPIHKQAVRRLTRTLKPQLMREWEGCMSYMLPSPAGTANEIHTISSKEVHNCSLQSPFDVHQPHYSTYCLSGQSYNVSTFKAFGVLGGGQSDSWLFQRCCASDRSWRRPSLLGAMYFITPVQRQQGHHAKLSMAVCGKRHRANKQTGWKVQSVWVPLSPQ